MFKSNTENTELITSLQFFFCLFCTNNKSRELTH